MIDWLRFVLILSVTVLDDALRAIVLSFNTTRDLIRYRLKMDCARQGPRPVARAPAVNHARLRRALRRSPGYLARRALESARYRTRRPWAYVYPRLLTERALLRSLGASGVDALWDDLARQPFFVSASDREARTARFVEEYPDSRAALVQAAEAALRHEFDLLGSGPRSLGTPLPWHTDFKTGREWPLAYCADIEYNELDRPTDVKVPWELSRCQHFTRLGQAYWLTGDERYAEEFVAETTSWIDANPLSYGVNWACAMDVALRAVSWIWGFHFFAQSLACRDRAFRGRFLRVLFMHGEFVVKHLEKADLNGNHYLCDGVGLVFLGCFFRRARSATRWLALGRAIVEQEVFEQTTPDGVDFEQATAYHRLVLEGFLTSYELLRSAGEDVPACVPAAAGAHVRVRPGLHQAGRTRAAHRRRGRRPHPDPGHAGDWRSPVPALARRRPVWPRRFQVVGGQVLGRDLLAPWRGRAAALLRACRPTRHPDQRRFATEGSTYCAPPKRISSSIAGAWECAAAAGTATTTF